MKIEVKLDEKKMDEIVEQYKKIYNSIYEQILEPLLDQTQDLTEFNEKVHFSTFYHILNLHLKFSNINFYDLLYNTLINNVSRRMENGNDEKRESVLLDMAKFGSAVMNSFMEIQKKYVPTYDEIRKKALDVVNKLKENE